MTAREKQKGIAVNKPYKILSFMGICSLAVLLFCLFFRYPSISHFEYGKQKFIPLSLSDVNHMRIEFMDLENRQILDLVHIIYQDGSHEYLNPLEAYSKSYSAIYKIPGRREIEGQSNLAIFVIPENLNLKSVRLVKAGRKSLLLP